MHFGIYRTNSITPLLLPPLLLINKKDIEEARAQVALSINADPSEIIFTSGATEANLSGILNWCLEGLALYRKEGLVAPAFVKEATEEYRQNSDKITLFVRESLIEDNNGIMPANDLYRVYVEWCKRNNYGEESKRTFFYELRAHNMLSETGTIDGKTVHNVIKGYIFIEDLFA